MYCYENAIAYPDAMAAAYNQYMGTPVTEFKAKYVDITPEERAEAITEYQQMAEDYKVVFSDSQAAFDSYIAVSIRNEEKTVKDFKKQIVTYKEQILKEPARETQINQSIRDTERSIRVSEEVTLPLLRYRLENRIVPNDGKWQNSAIDQLLNAKSSIEYSQPVSEEEFSATQYLKEQYKTYDAYTKAMQTTLARYNLEAIIAQPSLDTGEPDMKFTASSRNSLASFATGIQLFMLFAVLVGGWSIANEYQSGTIRMLMIRPKRRLRILADKFMAAVIICLGVYLISCLLNFLVNGLANGFTDYGYPNYDANGAHSFFSAILIRMLASMIPIFFMFTISFFLSVAARNVPVAIVVPAAGLIAAPIIITLAFAVPAVLKVILAYTPFPYLGFGMYFENNYTLTNLLSGGVPVSMPLGIGVLIAFSAVLMALSAVIFKKQEITG
jgi:ABC-type transport system involved in multi-copper enzyme maturation permease subunit